MGRTCPACGAPVDDGARFCDCGAEIGVAGPRSEAAKDPVSPKAPAFADGVPLTVEYDTIVPLLSEISGTLLLLLRISPDMRCDMSNLRVSLKSQDGTISLSASSRQTQIRPGSELELMLQIPPVKAGTYACDLTVGAFFNGVSHAYWGQLPVVVHDREAGRKVASQNITYVYSPTVQMGGVLGSRDRISTPSEALPKELLEGARQGWTDPLEEVSCLMLSGVHKYRQISLLPVDELPPRSAIVGEIALTCRFDDGARTIQLFADDIIQIGQVDGRNRYSDIIYRCPAHATGERAVAYQKISRRHCQIAWENGRITLVDGGFYSRNSDEIRPSTNGTFFDGGRVTEKITLVDGELGVGPLRDGLSLNVRLVRPSMCGRCCMPDAEREHCRNGCRPSVVLKRSDGVDETYVILWSCLDLGCVDSRLKGLVVRRDRRAFALVRDGESRWLECGTDIPLSASSSLSVSSICVGNL